MSRPKMTEAHRTQMRAQILDKAYTILIEKGPENISSRAIAKNLDLTHMGLFTYFPNQAAILKALAAREQAKLLERMQPFVRRAENADITQVLEDALRSLQDFARENPNLFRLMWTHPESDNENGDISHWNQPMFDWIAVLVEKGLKRGVFQSMNVQLSAATIIGMVNMPFILAYSGKMPGTEMVDKMAGEALAAAMQVLYRRLDEPVKNIEKQKLSPVAAHSAPGCCLLLIPGIFLQLRKKNPLKKFSWVKTRF